MPDDVHERVLRARCASWSGKGSPARARDDDNPVRRHRTRLDRPPDPPAAARSRQIAVRAHAVALNDADAAMLTAAHPTSGGTGKEYQAGYEFAGEVTAVGDGVTTRAVGDQVMGTTPGSFAQYVLADHRHILR